MRVTFFLFIAFSILGSLFWVLLSGVPFLISALLWLTIILISIGYYDTVVLFLLGARQVRSSDEEKFFEAASQEAYKLSGPMAHLYFYNGTLERAFVLQNRQNVSIVLSKSLFDKCSSAELTAICFELFLQVKKGMAAKRTKTMFALGSLSWLLQSFFRVVMKIIPLREAKQATIWFLNFLINPWMDFMFSLLIGKMYFRKLENLMSAFPGEKEMLARVGLKLRKPANFYSLTSRKLLELSSVNKNQHYQSILALEFLPHEWDYLFEKQEILSVK